MRELETVLRDRSYENGPSYTRDLAVMLQPGSYSELGAHLDFDEAFRRWTREDTFRGLDIARVWSMVLNLKHVLSRTSGSIAELGVYKGQSAALLSYYAEMFGRALYLADTFQGFAEAQYQHEEEMSEGKQVAFKDTSLEAAQRVVGDYAGNRWIVGLFPDSVTDEMRRDQYAFVSIDCDIYEPILEGLKFFWPRMLPGGMIFIHDYSSGHWPGATRAVDQFCAAEKVRGVLLCDLAGSYVLTRQDT
jgi:hypothetical protein